MFKFSNFYKEITLIQKYHEYLEKKKREQRRNNMIKFGMYSMLIVGGVALAMYNKNAHYSIKNLFKSLGGG
jgi:hypothetical protein